MNQSSAAQAENLAPAEEQLLAAILAGRRADLQGETIRASFLRDLVTEVHPTWVLPPIGIMLDNAMIQGTLDLEGCTVARPLVFQHCKFRPIEPARGAIQLRDAQLKRLALYKCSVTGSIFADRANIDSALFLSGSSIEGAIRLRGATIGEALAMDHMQIKNVGEVAVLADGLRLSGPWILREADIVGEVRLAGARIGGNLLWEDAKIQNNLVAVTADGAICEGAWLLRRTRISGPFRLRGMKIKAIDAQQITITAGSEAFNARGAEIASDLNLDGAVLKGGVLLGRANVAGELSAKGAKYLVPVRTGRLRPMA